MKHFTLGIALLLVFFTMSAQDITLSFENSEITTEGPDSFYEVDVMISSDVTFSMGSGQFFLDYNATAFGVQVANNSAIAYERPENSLLGGAVVVDVGGTPVPLGDHYTSFISNDTTDSKVSFIWQQNASGGMYGTNVPAGTPVALVHVKIRFLPGATGEDPSVCFDATNPFDDQFFTACGPFDPLVGFDFETADCQGEPGSQIFDYTPDCSVPVAFEITCQDITAQLDENGTVTITPEAVFTGDATDPDIDTLTLDIDTFTCDAIGENTVTLTVTTVDGSSATCTAIVTVEDTLAPEALCQNITVQLDINGNATITASQIDNGSTDNCGIASLSISQDTFTTANVGDNTVTLTVTDDSGNMATCDAIVTIVDQVFPEAVCQNITVQLDENGTATITATDVDGGSTGVDTLAIDVTSFDCSNIGENTVTLTVTSVDDHSDSCTAIVTVEDTLAPEAVCQNVTVQLDADGNATITASQIDNGSADNCGIASLSISQDTFTTANVGDNTVTLTVTDDSGNMATCDAIVTIVDQVFPEAVCQNITVQLDENGTATITATDVDGGSTGVDTLAIDVTSFDCSNIGENTVTLTVTSVDDHSDSCTAIVTVEDTLAPEAVCQNVTVQLDADGNATITASQIDNGSADNCGIASLSISQDTFTTANVGDNTVTLTVTDDSGNMATCDAIVTIVDQVFPEAVCQNITVQLDENGTATITATDVDGGSTGVDTLAIDVTSFDCSNIGENTVTLTVTSVDDHSDSCTAIVTVEDAMAPTVSCPDDQTVVLEEGNTTFEVPDYFVTGEASAVDNCTNPIAQFSQDPLPGTLLDEDTYTVTLCATDEFGNENCCEFQLTVDDNLSVEDAIGSSLRMYPNPANNQVFISNPNGLPIEMIAVYDVRGRRLATNKPNGVLNEISMDISRIANGTYFVRIEGAFGSISKQLIKRN